MFRYGLLIIALTAVSFGFDLPKVSEFECQPCAHPKQSSTVFIPKEGQLCFVAGEQVFQWPSSDDCPLPVKFSSPNFKLVNGIALAATDFCLDGMKEVPYKFMCRLDELYGSAGILRIQQE